MFTEEVFSLYMAVNNFFQGIKQTIPNYKSIQKIKTSTTLKSTYQQAIYFNSLSYMFPVFIYNLIINPLLEYFNLDTEENRIHFVLRYIYLFYCIRIIIELLLYNTLFTSCAAKLGAIDNIELDQQIEKFNLDSESQCQCEQSYKLKTILHSPVYYLSNHLFAAVVSTTISPFIANLMRTHIYGRALVESHLNTTGICVQHGQQWLSRRNFLCFGVGFSFIGVYYLINSLLASSLGFIRPGFTTGLNSIEQFILSDSVFCLLWLFYTVNIQVNAPLLFSSAEYNFNLYKANNKLALKILDFIKPKVKQLIVNKSERENIITKMLRKYQEYDIHNSLYYIFPEPFRSVDSFFAVKPVQLFISLNRERFIEVIGWMQSRTFSLTKTAVKLSDLFGGGKVLKGVANLWLPETLISLLFEFIAKGKFSSGNIKWLENKIQEATPEFDESQIFDGLNQGFRKLLGIERSHGFELLEERPDPVVIYNNCPGVNIVVPRSEYNLPNNSRPDTTSETNATINGKVIAIVDKHFGSRLR